MTDLNIPYGLPKTIADLIKKRKEISRSCEKLIEDIKKQEIAVNSVKTAGTVAGIGGTILLFTPLAPLGAVAIAGSAAGLVATSIGDFIANKVKGSSLKDELDSDKELAEKLREELKQANRVVERLMDQYSLSKDHATTIVFSTINNGGQVICKGVRIFESIEKIREVAYLTKALADLSKIGAFVEETTIALTAARVVSGTTKVLGAVGAVVNIADCVYSWLSDNPTKASAIQAKEAIDKSIDELQRKKDAIKLCK